jgi:hypothetical protein
MILIRERATGAMQWVLSLDGYDPAAIEQLGVLPEGLSPERAVWDGTAIVADPAWLAGVEADLHARIDAEAGAFRTRFITAVPGQELTYQRKEAEAWAWVTVEAPDLADYPFLAAEAAATGSAPGDAAAAIIAAAEMWAAIGSAIEGARIGAKRAVTAAADAPAKAAAAVVDWEALLAPEPGGAD